MGSRFAPLKDGVCTKLRASSGIFLLLFPLLSSVIMIANQAIPVFTTLADVFGGVEASLPHAKRWSDLAAQYEARFGKKPAYIARAPGRVNLIGDHIDYALFGVLPAAVDKDILIACGVRPSQASSETQDAEALRLPGSVVAENLHPKYVRQIFSPALKIPQEVKEQDAHVESWHLDINTKELRWESYVKAGYFGVLNRFFTEAGHSPIPVNLLVTGTVPAGSGLSSSAAMVVASTLAFLAANGKLEADGSYKPLNKGELVELAVKNEKRVGVNSGGMDQAASVMSDPSSALYITFYPSLGASAVPLPNRAVFIIANSLVVSDKAVGAKRGYNLRVVETLVGAYILAKSLGVEVEAKDKITYREVVGRFAGEKPGEDIGSDALEKALTEVEDKLDALKPTQPCGDQLGVTMDQMIAMTGLSKDVFHDIFLSWVDIEATYFQLYNRAKHVITEARRVLQFRHLCLQTSSASNDSTLLADLGRLMNESQDSCAKLFECSCPELDELTELARKAGAYGSRLTGAGWGGCSVSLIAEGKVDEFIQKIKETYPPYKNLEEAELREVIFATKPGRGACVYKLDT